MSWKDYFYFQKGDRIAILILFTLFVVSGGLYFLSKRKPQVESGITTQFENEFSDFQSKLTDIEDNTLSTREDHNIPETYSNKSRYPHITKLKKGENIEINKADTNLLKRIPGIGSSYANRIVKYRNLLGGYVTIEQLKEVWGLDNDLFETITPYLTIEPDVQKIKINSADFKALIKHPYINKEQVKIIIDIRGRKGRIDSINRLALLDEFTDGDIKRLTPYLSFD